VDGKKRIELEKQRAEEEELQKFVDEFEMGEKFN
jgi:hypothetical protein